MNLIRDCYADFGRTLACEKLRECHGLVLSRETVRHLMTEAGLWIPRRQRPPKIQQPRSRREVHRNLGGPLSIFNGEDSWTLPIPARYVIGQDGVIAYAQANADYTQRPEPDDLFPVLDRLKTTSQADA
ncbi:hypothetical protein [Paraburkholderia sp. BCC1884]|uniref:hypothetical protein n=1 Tax=Paraburkholderia sp. BCC1884 TaxID=2562668 RepID=UPI0016431E42